MKTALLGLALLAATLLRGSDGNAIVLELKPTADIPRNSEGAFATLRDGRILFCYTQYYGGDHDHSAARLAAIESRDDGLTWGEPRTILRGPDGEGLNVMSVSLVRVASGKLLLFYVYTKSAEDCRPFVCESADEGRTWSAPRGVIAAPGYFILNNDRAVQTSTGRLILPLNQHRRAGERGVAVWYFSDDEGATWRKSASEWGVADGKSGLQESGVVETADGSLYSWCRTDLGSQYACRSRDGGVTWSEPKPSELISPLSPASIKRLPGSPGLLAIYNDHSGRFAYVAGRRTPLIAAISMDGGQTWPFRKAIESDTNQWYHYTAIHFTPGAMLVAYNAGQDQMAQFRSPLRIRRILSSWLPRAEAP